EARVAARRSVAAQRDDAGPAPARLAVEEVHQLADAPSAGLRLPQATHSDAPHVGPCRLRQLDLVPARRQQTGRPLRPFDDGGAALQGLVETDLPRLVRAGEAVEVEMGQRQPRRLVDLAERERRAWHLRRLVPHQGRDQRPCERGLAGAHLAGQSDDIAAPDLEGEEIGQPDHTGLIEVERPLEAHARAASGAGSGLRMPLSGKRTVTRVPSPGSDSSAMVPPCSSTRLLTIDRPSPAPRCLEPWLRLSKRSSTRCCWSLGMPTPWSCTANATMPASRHTLRPMVSAGLEKPMALASRL